MAEFPEPITSVAPVQHDPDGPDTFSVDEALEAMPLSWFQLRVFCACGFAWMVDGIEVLLLAFIGPSVRCEWGVSDFQAASMTTIVFAGMSVGSVCWGAVADRFGRKLSLLISTAIILLAGMACSIANSFELLLFLRLLVGVGVSGAHVAFSLLVEWMPPRVRGRVGIALSMWWSLGAVTEAIAARLIMPTLGWRYLLMLSAAPALLLILASPLIPESPRYYLSRGKLAEAEASLKHAADRCGVALPPGKLAASSESQPAVAGKVSDLFTREMRRLTLSQWGLWFAAAFTYYGSVLLTTELLAADNCNYRAVTDAGGVPLLSSARCKMLSPEDYNENIIATAGEVPGIIVTFIVIDKLGRRLTIGWEALLMALAMVLVIPCISLTFQTTALFVMRGAADGLFQAAYVYTSEIYPSSIRGLGLGWCASFSRLGGMTTPFVAQVLSRSSASVALGVYAASAVMLGLIAFNLEIETLGRPMFNDVEALTDALVKARARRIAGRNWSELHNTQDGTPDDGSHSTSAMQAPEAVPVAMANAPSCLQADAPGTELSPNVSANTADFTTAVDEKTA